MRQYLVIANQTLRRRDLNELIDQRLREGGCAFYVLVPDTRVHDLTLGETGLGAVAAVRAQSQASAEARRRLEDMLQQLRNAGAEADGELGDPDPVAAAEKVLVQRDFDEVIVSMLPDRLSRWLKLDLPNQLRRRVKVPITVVTAASD